MNDALFTLADLWRPWRWPARTVFGVFALTQTLMAISAIAQSGLVIPVTIAAEFFLGALVLLLLNWGRVLPLGVAGVVSSLVIAVAFIEGPYGFVSSLRFEDWYLGAIVSVLMAMMMWGRTGIAWATFGIFSVIQVTLSAVAGASVLLTGPILLRHAGTLFVTWFIAITMRQVAKRLTESAERRTRIESEAAIDNAVSEERLNQFARIDSVAGRMLRRIATGVPLSDVERTECLTIEASLRDTMSGRGWARADVLDAAREARERGVTVVLLDDSGGHQPDADLARDRLVAVLKTLTSGKCTARMLPPDRESVASIVIEREQGGEVLDIRREKPEYSDDSRSG